MSIQLTITATDAVDLGAQIANLFRTITEPVAAPAVEPEVIDPPKKPRGRQAKAQVIEGTVETEKAPEPAAEEPAPEPAMSMSDLRARVLEWTLACAAGRGAEDQRAALDRLRAAFNFQKIPEIAPEKYADVVAWIEANPPEPKADDDGIV